MIPLLIPRGNNIVGEEALADEPTGLYNRNQTKEATALKL
jgi:hypothetical protein